jgi:predicted polyphosphate/ATP-dependent NAD kinase
LKTLGLIVNPVAGMGGRVGLKGTDGAEIQRICRQMGAKPEAPGRAAEALKQLEPIRDQVEIVTYPYDMGEDEAKAAGFTPRVIGTIEKDCTTFQDTRRAAEELKREGVDLILFAGGDGTARDVYAAVQDTVVALGIPAGVKIHSAVFATTPRTAGQLVLQYFLGKARQLKEAEVMDIDEEAFRQGRVSAELFGYLKIPYEKNLVQSMKAGRASSEESDLEMISYYICDEMQPDVLYILGPGTTIRGIKNRLNPDNTLLGVDVALDKKIIARDVSEQALLELMDAKPAKIVVTVIGGQGYIFGRGNQQISSRVIRQAGRENILVVATKDKITALAGKPLLVDTGDEETNAYLAGYMRVIAGYYEQFVFRVSA